VTSSTAHGMSSNLVATDTWKQQALRSHCNPATTAAEPGTSVATCEPRWAAHLLASAYDAQQLECVVGSLPMMGCPCTQA
jgi:hypothetical protein